MNRNTGLLIQLILNGCVGVLSYPPAFVTLLTKEKPGGVTTEK